MDKLIGEYSNFQQYWRENTEEAMHRSNSVHKHDLLHLVISTSPENDGGLSLKMYKGRDKTEPINELKMPASDIAHGLYTRNEDLIVLESNILKLSGLALTESCLDDPYQFLPCRYFSGWIQYPMDSNQPEVLTDVRHLTMHDQGDAVGVVINGQDYCIELTQLIYAHTISIMKLAIYEESPKQLSINSRAISYTWSDPESKRIGINLRNILTGWTYIEPGFISSNNLDQS